MTRLKRCSKCKEDKPYTQEYFYANKSRSSGLEARCKSCSHKLAADRHKRRLEKCPEFRQYMADAKRQQQDKRKDYILALKVGGCVICTYNGARSALHFHHIDPNDKSIQISSDYPIKRLEAEVKKCVLVCANCHAELHDGLINYHDLKRRGIHIVPTP